MLRSFRTASRHNHHNKRPLDMSVTQLVQDILELNKTVGWTLDLGTLKGMSAGDLVAVSLSLEREKKKIETPISRRESEPLS